MFEYCEHCNEKVEVDVCLSESDMSFDQDPVITTRPMVICTYTVWIDCTNCGYSIREVEGQFPYMILI